MLLTHPIFFTAALVLLAQNAIGQGGGFSLFNASDIYPPPTAPECAEALGSTVQCPALLLDAVPSSNLGISNLTASDLQSVCTQSCYASLMSVAEEVDSACQGWPFILGDTSYVASLPFRYYAYYWNLTCLFDNSASQYCLNEAQSSISNTDQSIVSLPLSRLCTFCNIQKLDVQMTSPFGWDASFVPDWQTIQGDCSFSASNAIPSGLLFNASNPLAANGTNTNVTATPTLTPASNASCVFGTYTIKSGDTCTSIAVANSLSYDQLVSVNGLDMNCTKLPSTGSNICLPGKCTTYTVQQSDTCVSIAEAKGIAWSQLLTWNPQIDTYCDNLSQQVGKTICVSPPGGGYQASSTVSYVTGSPTAIAVPTAPIAPGSLRSVCGLWYTAIPGDTCPQILSVFQITNDTFYELNPNLNSDCSNLLAGFSYCVAVYPNATSTSTTLFAAPTTPGIQFIQYMSGDFPAMSGFLTDIENVTVTPSAPPIITPPSTTSAPTATPTIAPGSLNASQCLTYYEIQPGDSCLAIELIYDVSLTQFIIWNPEVNEDCTNIEVGLSYCVFGLTDFTPTPISIPPPTSSTSSSSSTTTSSSPLPSNIASGTITSGCNQYYTVVSGDSCSAIESNFGITLDQFIAWNPEVNGQCTNIDVGLAYCVSGPTTTTTTSPTTGPTGAPVAPGTITTGCSHYYTIVSGDFCGSIDDRFGITLTQFLAWNTGVDTNCDNLLLGFQYCVSGPAVSSTTTTTTSSAPTASGTTPQCTEFYTVQSGDSCFAIEQKFDITMAQFLAWNTGLNSDCTNLLLGFEYCVAGP